MTAAPFSRRDLATLAAFANGRHQRTTGHRNQSVRLAGIGPFLPFTAPKLEPGVRLAIVRSAAIAVMFRYSGRVRCVGSCN